MGQFDQSTAIVIYLLLWSFKEEIEPPEYGFEDFSLDTSDYEYDGTYHEYQPDFVVETVDMRYLVEVKGMDKLNDPQVLAKKAWGQKYCQIVTDWATAAGSKPWQYLFIPEDAVQGSTTFEFLAANYGK